MDFRALRRLGGMRLKDVQVRTGIPVHRLSRIENGLKPRGWELEALCRLYGVDPQAIKQETGK